MQFTFSMKKLLRNTIFFTDENLKKIVKFLNLKQFKI